MALSSFQKDRCYDSLEFKISANNKFNIGANKHKPCDIIENIVGKGECWLRAFLLCIEHFHKPSSQSHENHGLFGIGLS